MAPSDVDRIFSDAPGERRGTTGWGEYRAYWGYEDRWEVRFVAED
ncbi:hypothetical protein [Nesterenkonia flava]|uniref:Uncharacterized protein n=1 Tax=Nesterenkonia flava TaxID=469799 RepID=A0ABU1FRX4_9MICC|nr:hypothetical protein [Nesterenkonia flava]MDR5711417.1 hypothetical protein [Nesterenkonia flava]